MNRFLTTEQVETLIGLLGPTMPVVVGGQAVSVLAAIHAGRDERLDSLSPLASEDLDLFEDEKAMLALAEGLARSRIHRPEPDDFTPNAGKVDGWLAGTYVEVDFLRAIKGVDARDLVRNAIVIATRAGLRMRIMHPLDCVRSRFANVNDLGRHDEHSLTQAEAAIRTLRLFLEDELERGRDGVRRAQKDLMALCRWCRHSHIGRKTEEHDNLSPFPLLSAFAECPRLDERWRRMTLAPEIERSLPKSSTWNARTP